MIRYKKHLSLLNYSLRPVMMNNTCPLRITATAGTKLVGPYLKNIVKNLLFRLKFYVLYYFFILFIITGSNFHPLSNIPHCCLVETGPCLSPGVAELPLSTAKNCRLEKHLSSQLPNSSYKPIL